MLARRGLGHAIRAASCAVASKGAPAVQGAWRHFSGTSGATLGNSMRQAGLWMLGGAVASVVFAEEALALSPAEERTFIAIKPDGVHRGLVSEIIARFERKGYKLVGIKVLVPPKELASRHYAEHDGKPFFPKLVNFLSSGPVVAMVWEGKEVIKYGRTMIGATNPLASAPGTIRGDFAVDMGRNIIHGSDSLESAQREISLWFGPDELAHYDLVTKAWTYE